MKRAVLFLAALVMMSASDVRGACTTYVRYAYVQTEWWDGKVTGTWQYDGSYTVCSGSTSYASGPGGGGFSTCCITPPAITTLQKEYETYGCAVPVTSSFDNETRYNADPAANYTFRQLSGGNSYAIITGALKFGLDQMVNMLDGYVPTVTSAYRSPSQNSGTSGSARCSAHTYGTAADLSIRDANGSYSCTIWNMFAEAADGWIEPWDETVRRGTPHFHVDFGRPKNDPGTCTGYP